MTNEQHGPEYFEADKGQNPEELASQEAQKHLDTAGNLLALIEDSPGNPEEAIVEMIGAADKSQNPDDLTIANEVGGLGILDGTGRDLVAAELDGQPPEDIAPALREIAEIKGDKAAQEITEAIDDVTFERGERLDTSLTVSRAASLLKFTSQREGINLTKLEYEIPNPGALLSSLHAQEVPTVQERHRISVANIQWLQHRSLWQLAPVRAGSVGKEEFDKTQRDRGMFRVGTGAASRESYASELFAAAANPEITTYVAESLSGKTVLNLGGGNAKIAKELQSMGVDINMKNIEPYPSDRALEDPDSDPIIAENPALPGFFEKSGVAPHSADEIWAVFSVPAYLGTAPEVATLFDTIKTALKPGGVARIGHLGFVHHSSDELKNDPRMAALFAELEDAAGGGYLIEPVETKTKGVITLVMTAPGA